MSQIFQYVRHGDALDPEALGILGVAYDRAIAALQSRDIMSTLVCETVAGRIIDAWKRGERNLDTLHELALLRV